MSIQLKNLIQAIKTAIKPGENTAIRVGTTLELLDSEKADVLTTFNKTEVLDLINEVKLLATSGATFIGNISPSTSFPAGNIWGFASPGNYPNANNITVSSTEFAVISRVNGTFAKTAISLPEQIKQVHTINDSQNGVYINADSTLLVTVGNGVQYGFDGVVPDVAAIKVPVKAGDRALVFTKQGAFSPCFITDLSNIVTAIYGTPASNYLGTPLDITCPNDGYLYLNAHEFTNDVRSIIGIYLNDAYYLMKRLNPTTVSPSYTDIIVKKGGTIGTDCDFTDLKTALSSITDNSAIKRYKVYVMDGNYDYSDDGTYVPIKLKNYVTLVGQSYNTRLIKRDSVFSWAKAVVDKVAGDVDYIAIEGYFTIISNNCKCPLHIDSNKVKYGLFQNINLINEQALGTGDNPVDGEANCFALGWSNSDHIVLKNIKANGKLWGHNVTDSGSKGIFELINCTSRTIQIGDLTSQGSDTVVVKGCNADEFQLLWFSEFTSIKPIRSSFNFDFQGNNISNAIIKDHAGTHDALSEYYNGKYPFAIAEIHKEMYGTGITKGDTVSRLNASTVKKWVSGETVFGTALESTDVNGRLLIQLAQ